MALLGVKKKKENIFRFFPILLLFFVLLGLLFFADQMSTKNQSYSYEILDQALSRSITQCYALEGTYPPDIKYLQEHYGLTYDEDTFYIDYQYIGSNLRPDVTIIERNQERN